MHRRRSSRSDDAFVGATSPHGHGDGDQSDSLTHLAHYIALRREELATALYSTVLEAGNIALDSYWLSHAPTADACEVDFALVSEALVYFMRMLERGNCLISARVSDVAMLEDVAHTHLLKHCGFTAPAAAAAAAALGDAALDGPISVGSGTGMLVAYVERSQLPSGDPVALMVRLRRPLNTGAEDGIPLSHVFIVVAAHEHCANVHAIAVVVAAVEHCPAYHDELLLARSLVDLHDAVRRLARGAVRIEEELDFASLVPSPTATNADPSTVALVSAAARRVIDCAAERVAAESRVAVYNVTPANRGSGSGDGSDAGSADSVAMGELARIRAQSQHQLQILHPEGRAHSQSLLAPMHSLRSVTSAADVTSGLHSGRASPLHASGVFGSDSARPSLTGARSSTLLEHFARDHEALVPLDDLFFLYRFFRVDDTDEESVLHRVVAVCAAQVALNRLCTDGAVVQPGMFATHRTAANSPAAVSATATPVVPVSGAATPAGELANASVDDGDDCAVAAVTAADTFVPPPASGKKCTADQIDAELAALRSEIRAEHAEADAHTAAQVARVLGVADDTAEALVHTPAPLCARAPRSDGLASRSSSTIELAPASDWAGSSCGGDAVVAEMSDIFVGRSRASSRMSLTFSSSSSLDEVAAGFDTDADDDAVSRARARASSMRPSGLAAAAAAARAKERERVAVARHGFRRHHASLYRNGVARDLWAELTRTLRWTDWAQTWRPGLCAQAVPAIIYLAIACLTPAISFGSIFMETTHGAFGITECILGNFLVGSIYALFSGQPMLLVGPTGPVMILVSTLAELARMLPGVDMDAHFLALHSWVCLWTSLFVILMAVLEISNVVRFFTRFTNELFSMLVGVLFIIDPIKRLVKYTHQAFNNAAEPVPDPDLPLPDMAFLAIITCLGTFFIGSALASFRHSRYAHQIIRNLTADFASPLAVMTMTLIDRVAFPTIETAGLDMPTGQIRPSSVDGRLRYGPDGAWWVVRLLPEGCPRWLPVFAAAPAAIAAVLVLLDHQITASIANDPANKLKRAPSYHWDLALIGITIALSGVLGLPMHVAATVRALSHMRAMALTEESVNPETRAPLVRTLAIRENRLTPLCIALLNGASLFATSVLAQIPFFVVSGVFLAMGFGTFAGSTFKERIGLLFTQKSLYPPLSYVRNVPYATIILYTLFQLAVLGVLFGVQASPVALLFPILLLAMVPVRKRLMPRMFGKENIAWLDGVKTEAEQA